MKWNKFTSGLFLYRGCHYWRNIKDIPIFFKRIFFMLKHGYSPVARWDYYAWFIDTSKDIFNEYLKDHVGYKIINDKMPPEWNEQAWENIVKEMIDCLNKMDQEYYSGTEPKRPDKGATKKEIEQWHTAVFKWNEETHKEMYKAKRRFFMLMNKYFYDLWD